MLVSLPVHALFILRLKEMHHGIFMMQLDHILAVNFVCLENEICQKVRQRAKQKKRRNKKSYSALVVYASTFRDPIKPYIKETITYSDSLFSKASDTQLRRTKFPSDRIIHVYLRLMIV